jgi:hypothetical protein
MFRLFLYGIAILLLIALLGSSCRCVRKQINDVYWWMAPDGSWVH